MVHQNSWFHLSIFLSGVPSFSRLYHREAPCNHCKASPGFLSNFSLFYHPYYRSSSWRLHGGSSRILFILQLFFKISLEAMIRQAILQVFFILHSEVQFFLSYLLRWCYVILDYFFMFHDSQVVGNEIIKSIIFSSFKNSLPLLSYQFIRCFQILSVVRWRPFSSLRYISLNPFYEKK